MTTSDSPFLTRARIRSSLRAALEKRGYREVITPVLGEAPGADPEIKSFTTEYLPVMEPDPGPRKLYLHTSPEFAMKRLLCRGLENIYQICPVFRQGEHGHLHCPEFIMAEWYRNGVSYLELMHEVEQVVAEVTRGEPVRLDPPFPRIKVAEAMQHAGVNIKEWEGMTEARWRDRFFKAFAEKLGPWLARRGPLFLMDFPVQLAQLSKLRPRENPVAERFELVVSGVEIANGASELTDPEENRSRLEKDLEIRAQTGKSSLPLPEAFLADLENLGLPECAGVALGVDRLAMIASDAERIEQVMALPFAR